MKIVRVLSLAGILGAWVVLLRPVSLGGDTTYVIIAGESMEPVLQRGDLAVLRRSSRYSNGDIVAFPVGAGGVIHRIVGGDERGFEVKGDNRRRNDHWTPTADEIVGSMAFRIPSGGYAVNLLRQPQIAATISSVVGFLVVFLYDGGSRASSPRSLRSCR